nr:hypothetical protein [Tanacetum cinerariifolium]
MGIIIKLHNRMCAWPAVRAMKEEEDKDDDEGDEADGGGTCNEEAGGSSAMYRNMSQGDWQIHPFPKREANYPPCGYTSHMAHGYEYRFRPAPGGSKLYLTRRILKVLRKFHLTTLGGRFNQLSHISSPLLSNPREY